MAVPVINETTSSLSYNQFEEWEYQPFATNAPTSWSAPNLPDGLTINATTGRISGAATVAGVFNVGLVATNGSGSSTELVLTIGIKPAAMALTSPGYEVEFDFATRRVKVIGAEENATEPALFGKYRDEWIFLVRLVKGSAVLDLEVEKMGLAVRIDPLAPPIALGTAWHKYGSGSTAIYALYTKLDDIQIFAKAQEEATDEAAFFDAITELEIVAQNQYAAEDVGGATIRTTSRDFPARLALDSAQVS